MRRAATILAMLTLFIAPAGSALAQVGPLPPAPPPQAPPPLAPPPAPGQTFDTKDDGLSTRQQLLVVAAAAALIGVIGWVIVRDARRSAPVAQQRSGEDAPKPSARERERVKRQRRDKGKAARQQRKRNRPR